MSLSRWIRDLSIPTRLSLLMVMTSAAVLTAALAVLVSYQIRREREARVAEWIAVTEVVGANCSAALAFSDQQAAGGTLSSLENFAPIQAAGIFLPDGRSFASWVRPGISAAVIPGHLTVERPVSNSTSQIRVTRAIHFSGRPIGMILLVGQADSSGAHLQGYFRIVVWLLALSVPAAFGLSAFFRRWLSIPILQLSDAARLVSRQTDAGDPITKHGRDEVGVLYDAFIEMLGQIQTRDLELLDHHRQLEATVEARTAELVHANEQLREAKNKAEAAVRAKTEFLANISHELRTPLHAIVGMTGILLDSRLADRERDYVETIRHSSDNLLTIINDVLDFAKIEANRMSLELTPVDLRQCAESAMELVAPQAYGKGLELILDLAPGTPPLVMGDITRLRQVLLNLLSNAVKFAASGDVSVRVEPGRPEDGQQGIRFCVEDSGIGIQSEQLERLFDAFTQADSSTTRRFGGTGLGLAICRRLVGLMGGRIWAEAAPTAGSRFWFTIAAPTVASSERARLGPARALVLDGHAGLREVMARRLEEWGIETGCASSAREAAALAEGGARFDVVLLDFGSGGREALQRVSQWRVNDSPNRVPVILMVPIGSSPGDLPAAHSLVQKPLRDSVLYEAVAAALGSLDRENQHPPQKRQAVTVASRLRVLLAEDNHVNQKVLALQLARLGVRPDIVANGLEALDAVMQTHYDLVLMDVSMPEMDGIEATRRIRSALPPALQPRVVAMTANAFEEDRHKCLDAGMDDFFGKPVRAEELAKALEDCHAVLSGRRNGDS
ncbi:MAG: ATP-binding protein [Bryobacteraceae bacterium]